METTFYEVIFDYVSKAPSKELVKIKSLIDAQLGDVLSTFEGKARHIKVTQGGLYAVKFIRDEKKWDIRTAKEYMDSL